METLSHYKLTQGHIESKRYLLLTLTATQKGRYYHVYLFRWGNYCSDKLSDIPSITQLRSSRVQMQPWFNWLQFPCSFHCSVFYFIFILFYYFKNQITHSWEKKVSFRLLDVSKHVVSVINKYLISSYEVNKKMKV